MAQHILHFSAGTLLFILLCVGLLGGCLVTGAVLIASAANHAEVVSSPEELPSGELGPIGRSILETKMSASQMEATWGPVNKEKLTETKQGWLIDRLRARRMQRSRCAFRQVSYPVRYTVVQAPRYPVAPLPSPIPSNPMVPVVPVDVIPSVPRTPAPDIQAKLPEWVVPSVKSDYCETGTCNLR